MANFSERAGMMAPPKMMQLEEMSTELSNGLFNFCIRIHQMNPALGIDDGEFWAEIAAILNEETKRRIGTLQLTDLNMLGDPTFAESQFQHSYDQLAWHEKYTLIEIIMNSEEISPDTKSELVINLNQILERENSGYRFDNSTREFIAVTDPVEIESVTTAMSSGIEQVDNHMHNAIRLFSDRISPDYANASNEAISALEALARSLQEAPNQTLGQLARKLPIHGALQEAIKNLYGFTSDAGGIRHAMKEADPDIDDTTAKFLIVTVSALINYTLALAREKDNGASP